MKTKLKTVSLKKNKKKSKKKDLKVGLVFSGGGSKGFAHLGVYDVLYKNNVKIDAISGCSIGAMMAAFVAQGIRPSEIYEAVAKFADNKKKFFSFKVPKFAKGSILDSGDEINLLKEFISPDLLFEDLKIPLAINAVSLESAEEVVFTSGSVLSAVSASMAFPGVFPPVYYRDQLLIDGGILNTVPVNHCLDLGVDRTIVVDLKSYYSAQHMSGLIYHFYIQKKQERKFHFKSLTKIINDMKMKLSFPLQVLFIAMSIAQDKNIERILEKYPPDVNLNPDVGRYNLFDFSEYEAIYQAGVSAALEKIKIITDLRS